MNERIRELAEQTFSFKYKTAPDELNPGHKLQDLEKFAELIVRECLLKVNGAKIRGESMDDLIDRIKEDFGVEE